MQVSDPFRLNDWGIKKFLGAIFAVQIAMLAVICIDSAGIHVPIIRPVICFIYLTFIPGALVIRALGIHGLGSIKSLLFTVGSSLATLMFTGVLLNSLGPYLNIAKPISILPITAMLTALVLILSVICYLRDRNFGEQAKLDLALVISPPGLFLYTIPFLAILGTFLMNYYDANILLILLIIVVAAVLLLVGFDSFIPKKLFPLAIFVTAISLAFHNSLISSYLNGWDIHAENYYATLVISNGSWVSSLYNELNSMLSIVMIAPIYSILTDMDTVWVFKIIYPFLFGLVPVGLYEVYRRQADEKIAFFSSFFFISLVVFYTEMMQLARQEIAELFLVLVIMLIVDHSIDKARWSELFVLFSFSIVLSHYGLTYIFLGALVIVWLLIFLSKKLRLYNPCNEDLNNRLSPFLILALITFCVMWYMYTAGGNPLITILSILYSIYGSLQDFMDPNKAQGLSMITTGGTVSILHRLYLYLMLSTQLMIVIGIVTIILKWGIVIKSREYFAFALVMLMVLIAGIAVPFFASALNTTRLYQIALIFLAIFLVIGWLNAFKLPERLFNLKDRLMPMAFRTLALFLTVFLFINTGLIFELFNDAPISYALNKSIDTATFSSQELASADWILSVRNATLIDSTTNTYFLPPIYTDQYRLQIFKYQNLIEVYEIPENDELLDNSFIYLGTYNVDTGQVLVVNRSGVNSQATYAGYHGMTTDRGEIYTNGGSDVYYRIFS